MREDTPIKKKVLRELVEKEMNALQEEQTEFEKITNDYAKTLASLQISQNISSHQFYQDNFILENQNQITTNGLDLVDSLTSEFDASNHSFVSTENTREVFDISDLEHDLSQQKTDIAHEDFEVQDIENHLIENLQHQSNRNSQMSTDIDDELEL